MYVKRVDKRNLFLKAFSLLEAEKSGQNAILSRMRWRNAIHDSHQTLRVQKLWAVCNTTRTDGTKREAETFI